MTLGVRIMVENENNEILLVRHTYVEGWYLPGGGVETGEHAHEAAEKELREETALQNNGELEIISIHFNTNASRRDHVILYRCEIWEDLGSFSPNREIAEARFFPIDALPAETTDGTRRRINEVYFDVEISRYW